MREEHFVAFRTALLAAANRFTPPGSAAGETAWLADFDRAAELMAAEPLPYLPGQHLSVQTPRWPRLWRRYSIADAPRDDGSLALHVRAVQVG